MGLSTRQIPYIGATVVLFIGGILFFAFPWVVHTHTHRQTQSSGHCRSWHSTETHIPVCTVHSNVRVIVLKVEIIIQCFVVHCPHNAIMLFVPVRRMYFVVVDRSLYPCSVCVLLGITTSTTVTPDSIWPQKGQLHTYIYAYTATTSGTLTKAFRWILILVVTCFLV